LTSPTNNKQPTNKLIVYPVLLIRYISENEMIGELTGEVRFWAIVAFTLSMTYLTWRGLDVNGMTCVLLCAFVLLPFLCFSVIGAPQVDPSNWFLGPMKRNHYHHEVGEEGYAEELEHGGEKKIRWHAMINVLFWNLNYFHSASAFSGDCLEPVKTFPKCKYFVFVYVYIYT
jgi:hypothetical protein